MFSELVVLISLDHSKRYISVFDFFIRCFMLDNLQMKAKRLEFEDQIFLL